MSQTRVTNILQTGTLYFRHLENFLVFHVPNLFPVKTPSGPTLVTDYLEFWVVVKRTLDPSIAGVRNRKKSKLERLRLQITYRKLLLIPPPPQRLVHALVCTMSLTCDKSKEAVNAVQNVKLFQKNRVFFVFTCLSPI